MDIFEENCDTENNCTVSYFWKGLALFLLGVIIGLFVSPIKKGVTIGCNNKIDKGGCNDHFDPDEYYDDYNFDDDEDEVLRTFGESGQVKAKVVYFSSLRELSQGIFLRGKEIVLRAGEKEFVITTTDRLKILGRHNHENTMAAAAMAYYAGVPVENIKKSVENFVAVEHRIEYVTEKNGVVYYNDSKGTNPDAAIKGIQAMDRPTLLIGGGYDKQSSYDEWIEAFDGKVRFLVLIGQTREKIEETAHKCGFMNTILADNLEEAVKICAEKANKGDAVLLSPACASWGQFDNYEQRGRMFKEYVYALPEADA